MPAILALLALGAGAAALGDTPYVGEFVLALLVLIFLAALVNSNTVASALNSVVAKGL